MPSTRMTIDDKKRKKKKTLPSEPAFDNYRPLRKIWTPPPQGFGAVCSAQYSLRIYNIYREDDDSWRRMTKTTEALLRGLAPRRS